jgi:uncharacterized protein
MTLFSRFPCGRVLRAYCLSAIGLFALAICLLPVASARSAEAGTEPLSIVTSSGSHEFAVEVMRTRAQLEKGLMFRRYLPADRGMLFDFKTEQSVMMWMKNTYISLDMIFIGKSGRVVSVAADTEPMSEKIIPSGGPVLAVLEVNAGIAAKIGLKAGDRVHFPLFGS